MRRKPAIVLLSGGLDSATVAAIAIREGYEVSALSFDYGQRHRHELISAQRVAESLGIKRHEVVKFDLRAFGGSSLTSDAPVPQADPTKAISQIPSTYVPGRNTIFLAFALSFAEVVGASDIFLGVNATDYAGYPDCRPEFVQAFEQVALAGTRIGAEGGTIKIHAPLLRLSKSETIRAGLELDVDYSLTSTCYDPGINGDPCGRCDACYLRREGFNNAGVEDPLMYPAEVA
ncbi:7-cyano-7-deazaguanine synthase QueC [Cyanobium sp. N5-Cardenillas]|nr:7-cyano-7-deazaguanine synthase QueC [Cyanobium sp. N5-Cardenillas]